MNNISYNLSYKALAHACLLMHPFWHGHTERD